MATYLIQNGVNKRSTTWVDKGSSSSPSIEWNVSSKLRAGCYVGLVYPNYATLITGWNAKYDASAYDHLYITGYFSGADTCYFSVGSFSGSHTGSIQKAASESSTTYKFDLSSLSSSIKSNLQTFMYGQRYWRVQGTTYGYISNMWLTKDFTVTYNANGGSGAPATQTLEEGTRNLSSTVPTRSGYEFLGWSTSASATTATYSAGQQITISGDLYLYAVWKGLGSTINTMSSSVATQGNFSMGVNYFNGAYYQKVVFKKDNASGATLATSSAFRSSLNYTVPRTWFNNYGSVSSLTVCAILYTYTDSSCTTQIGNTDSRTFTVTADAGMAPSLASGVCTLSPYNTGTGAASLSDNLYIKGFSKVRAVFDASKITWGAGASAGSYAIKVENTTTSGSGTTQTSSNKLANAGSITIQYTVTDSRGLSTSGTATISVSNYAAPTISLARCERTSVGGEAQEEGLYITVRATATKTNVSNNAVGLKVAYMEAGGSYGTAVDLTAGTDLTIGGAINADKTYIVAITATDTLGTETVLTQTLPARTWPLHMIKDGVAIGQKATEPNTLRIRDIIGILRGDEVINGFLTLTNGSTSGGVSTLPTFGTWLILCMNTNAEARTGIFLYNTSSNLGHATKLAGASDITITASGKQITVTTGTGTCYTFAIKLSSKTYS